MRIAILQCDPIQSTVIETAVKQAGHLCHAFDDGLSISKALARSTFDLIVLDWDGVRLSGEDVLKAVRSSGGDRVPVVFASSDDREASVVRAFAAGADDYVKLPLRPDEFRERIAALLRRAYPDGHDTTGFNAGAYHFDACRKRVSVRGEPVKLSGTQYRLASLFFSNIGRELSRDHIFAMVWGGEFRDFTRTIDSHVSRLRTLLALDPKNGFRLQPVYRRGYCLLQLRQCDIDEHNEGNDTAAASKRARARAVAGGQIP